MDTKAIWWITLIGGFALLVGGIVSKQYIISVIGIVNLLVAWARYAKVFKRKD